MPDEHHRDPSGPLPESTPVRPAARWLILAVVWGAGMAVWLLYLSAILYMLFKLP